MGKRIRHKVDAAFVEVAERNHLTPERLAELVCNDFAKQPPDAILIISRVRAATAKALAPQPHELS